MDSRIEKFTELLFKHIPFFKNIKEEYYPYIDLNTNCIPREVMRIKFPYSNDVWTYGIIEAAKEFTKDSRSWICFCDKCAKNQHLTIFFSSGYINE